MFRTAPGTKLLELALNDTVPFEIDGIDGIGGFDGFDGFDDIEAWSAVIKGCAERLEHQSDMDHAETLGLTP